MELIFKGIYEYIQSRNGGLTLFIIEASIVLILLVMFLIIIGKSIGNAKVTALLVILAFATVIAFAFGMIVLGCILLLLFMWMLGLSVFLYGKNIKRKMDGVFSKGAYKKVISETEKTELIASLCKTTEYFARRKVGALISIERYDNLNAIIEKSIRIDGNVSEELLTTIFTVGTACHDGGVIIRGNKIACASAYFPSTDKYDIPKSLGTRHRAAIGLSERYDAFTIVVSEETGYISYTIDGNIYLNVTVDKLKEELNNYIKVE